MSQPTSQPLAKTFLQWVQLDSKKYQVELDQLLEQVSLLIDTSLSIATRLQRYRRYLLEPESQDLDMI